MDTLQKSDSIDCMVCGHSLAGIAGLNPGGMDVCLLRMFCFV